MIGFNEVSPGFYRSWYSRVSDLAGSTSEGLNQENCHVVVLHVWELRVQHFNCSNSKEPFPQSKVKPPFFQLQPQMDFKLECAVCEVRQLKDTSHKRIEKTNVGLR